MTDSMLVAMRFNCWATQALLEHCAALDEAQLIAGAPAVFGSPLATLEHLLRAEAFYVSMIRGAAPTWRGAEGEPVTIEVMQRWAGELAVGWEEVLSRPQDGDRLLIRTRRDGSVTNMPAGVLLAQALHHANVHREQVCSILTAQGLQPPDLSAWAYGYATGLMQR